MRSLVAALLVAFVLLCLVACGPFPAELPVTVCTPNVPVACVCDGVAPGTQACSADGSHLDPCRCPDAGPLDAGRGAGDAGFDVVDAGAVLIDDPPTATDRPERDNGLVCAPGSVTEPCSCVGGGQGVQICNDAGTAFIGCARCPVDRPDAAADVVDASAGRLDGCGLDPDGACIVPGDVPPDQGAPDARLNCQTATSVPCRTSAECVAACLPSTSFDFVRWCCIGGGELGECGGTTSTTCARP